jgi:hypothetical protein
MAGIPLALLGSSEFQVGLEYPDEDVATPAGLGRSAILVFTMELQARPHWCWNAVAVSLARFYFQDAAALADGTPLDQCSLVGAVLGCQCSCDPPDNLCDGPAQLENVLPQVRCGCTLSTGAMGFDDIFAEVTAGRPIACGIQWGADGDYHDVVICGAFEAADGSRHVQVGDPMAPLHIRTMPLEVFTTSFRGLGQWVYNWKTWKA